MVLETKIRGAIQKILKTREVRRLEITISPSYVWDGVLTNDDGEMITFHVDDGVISEMLNKYGNEKFTDMLTDTVVKKLAIEGEVDERVLC